MDLLVVLLEASYPAGEGGLAAKLGGFSQAVLRQLPVQLVVPSSTLSVGGVPVGGRADVGRTAAAAAHLPGAGQASAVEEDGQVDDVPHVVVSVDKVPQDAVEVLVDGLDDDVRVAGKDGDEGTLGEQDSHLRDDGGPFVR